MSSVFDDHANEYDAWFRENDQLFRSELDAVKSMMDADKSYVEVGVGTGLFATALGIREGIEPSEEMAKIAKQRGIYVCPAIAEELPYEDNSIDGIVMITVDCFVKDIDKVFSEAHRVLTRGGSYVMAFLDRETPLGKCYEENKDNDVYYRDAIFRSASEMREHLAKAGLRVERSIETVYTLENKIQPIRDGNGNGVFAIIKATKEI